MAWLGDVGGDGWRDEKKVMMDSAPFFLNDSHFSLHSKTVTVEIANQEVRSIPPFFLHSFAPSIRGTGPTHTYKERDK